MCNPTYWESIDIELYSEEEIQEVVRRIQLGELGEENLQGVEIDYWALGALIEVVARSQDDECRRLLDQWAIARRQSSNEVVKGGGEFVDDTLSLEWDEWIEEYRTELHITNQDHEAFRSFQHNRPSILPTLAMEEVSATPKSRRIGDWRDRQRTFSKRIESEFRTFYAAYSSRQAMGSAEKDFRKAIKESWPFDDDVVEEDAMVAATNVADEVELSFYKMERPREDAVRAWTNLADAYPHTVVARLALVRAAQLHLGPGASNSDKSIAASLLKRVIESEGPADRETLNAESLLTNLADDADAHLAARAELVRQFGEWQSLDWLVENALPPIPEESPTMYLGRIQGLMQHLPMARKNLIEQSIAEIRKLDMPYQALQDFHELLDGDVEMLALVDEVVARGDPIVSSRPRWRILSTAVIAIVLLAITWWLLRRHRAPTPE